jgi:GrpB-like predicted nucleotidyltransferase (UPF0157 family)
MSVSVRLVDYDSRWPAIYERQRKRILKALGREAVAVEHVGSTAVVGLGAKPIVDIMVGVRCLSVALDCIEPLKKIGYEYVPEHEAVIPDRRFFRKGPEDVPNKHFHLHMVEWKGEFWNDHLLFRDYLRAHPSEAELYYRLKKRSAKKHCLNREAYTDAKTSFIERTLKKARTHTKTEKDTSE